MRGSGSRILTPRSPLLRSYIELLIVMAYVLRKPDYIHAVMNDPAEWKRGMPKRKGTQALMALARQEFPTIDEPYDELSDMGHFGTTAMWSAFTPTELEDQIGDDKTRDIEWTNIPSWRHPDDPMKAAAHLLEFAQGFAQVAEKIIQAHLLPLKPPAK